MMRLTRKQIGILIRNGYYRDITLEDELNPDWFIKRQGKLEIYTRSDICKGELPRNCIIVADRRNGDFLRTYFNDFDEAFTYVELIQ